MSLYRAGSVDSLSRGFSRSVPARCPYSGSPDTSTSVSTTSQPRAKVPSWYRDLHHALLSADNEDNYVTSERMVTSRRSTLASTDVGLNWSTHAQRGRFPQALQRTESCEIVSRSDDEWRRSKLSHNGQENGLRQLNSLSRPSSNINVSGFSREPAMSSDEKVFLDSSRTKSRKQQLNASPQVRPPIDDDENSIPQMTSRHRVTSHCDSIAEYPSSSYSQLSMTSSDENAEEPYSLHLLPVPTTPRSTRVVAKPQSTGSVLGGTSTADDSEEIPGYIKLKGGGGNESKSGHRDWCRELSRYGTPEMERDAARWWAARQTAASANRRHSSFVLGGARQGSVDEPNKRQFKWEVAETKTLNRPVSITDRRASNSSGLLSGILRQEFTGRRASSQVIGSTRMPADGLALQPETTCRVGRWTPRTTLDDVAKTLADKDFYAGFKIASVNTGCGSKLSKFRSVEALCDVSSRSRPVTLSDAASNGSVNRPPSARLDDEVFGEVDSLMKSSVEVERNEYKPTLPNRRGNVGGTDGNRHLSDAATAGRGSPMSSSQTRHYSELPAATSRRPSIAQFWSPIIRLASSDWSPFSRVTSSGTSGGRGGNVSPWSESGRSTLTLSSSMRRGGISAGSVTGGYVQPYQNVARRPETIGMVATGNQTESNNVCRVPSKFVVQDGNDLSGTAHIASKPTADDDNKVGVISEKTRGSGDVRVVMTSGSDIRLSALSGKFSHDSTCVSNGFPTVCDVPRAQPVQLVRARSVLNVSLSGAVFLDAEKNGRAQPSAVMPANETKVTSSMFVKLDESWCRTPTTETTPRIRVIASQPKSYDEECGVGVDGGGR